MKLCLTIFVFLFIFTGCSTAPVEVMTPTSPTSLPEIIGVIPTDRKTEQGNSSLFGQLFLPDGTPLHHTTLYLTPGIGDEHSAPIILIGPDLEKGDYLANSDSEAYFEFPNVRPGIYYLVVSSTNNYHYFLDGTTPIALSVEADQRLDLGKIIVDTR
jgi:hypothetical protein